MGRQRNEDANTYLERAYQHVIKVVSATKDEALRKSWLEDGYFNRQIVSDWVNYHGLL